MDQRRHQPRFLGHARTHHGHEHDGHDAEAGEVRHERGEDKADTLRRQQAANGDGLFLYLIVGVVWIDQE